MTSLSFASTDWSCPDAKHRFARSVLGLISLIISTAGSAALAQQDPSGIEFVTVRSPNNAAYSGPDVNHLVTGRGSVGYEYKLGRTEVTTAQWVEFYNAFSGRVSGLSRPIRWGAYPTGLPQEPFRTYPNSDSGLWPVSGVTWRTSAMFCNWLHNGKSTDLSAIQNGAYDISTFGYEPAPRDNVFTDQRTHNADARYWIPTLDEWIKGAYYDPNYGGPDVGGWWWNSVNGSNVPLVYGPPGIGQANVGFDPGDQSIYSIPLMAYPDTVSPWGLLDAAGATSELLESISQTNEVPWRFIAGSRWGLWSGGDAIYNLQTEFPSIGDLNYGFRVAAIVPSSAPLAVVMTVVSRALFRRRRAI